MIKKAGYASALSVVVVAILVFSVLVLAGSQGIGTVNAQVTLTPIASPTPTPSPTATPSVTPSPTTTASPPPLHPHRNKNAQHTPTLTPTQLNIASMLTMWYKPSSHTQTTIQKQPKPKKHPNQKPQGSVQFLAPHTHTKRTQLIKKKQLTLCYIPQESNSQHTSPSSSHPTNMEPCRPMGQNSTFPIPTTTEKQPKPKNQTAPQPKHGTGKNPAPPIPTKNKKIRLLQFGFKC